MTVEERSRGLCFDFSDAEGEATPLPPAVPQAPDPGFPTGKQAALEVPASRTQPLWQLQPGGDRPAGHRAGGFEPSDSPLATAPMSQAEIARGLVALTGEPQRAAARPETMLVSRLPPPGREPLWPYAVLLIAGLLSGLLVGIALA